jgi:DNA-binding HxlR family transcriptional regulator
MYERKIPETYECGISIAIKVLGGKWKAWVLDCIERGKRRPNDIHKEVNEAAPRVINMLLKELVELGILYKKVYEGLPIKVEYYLTDLGTSLLPVIASMNTWGEDNREAILQKAKKRS